MCKLQSSTFDWVIVATKPRLHSNFSNQNYGRIENERNVSEISIHACHCTMPATKSLISVFVVRPVFRLECIDERIEIYVLQLG